MPHLRSDALHGGGRQADARRSKAGARPDVGAVESGSFLGVTTDDTESFATFRCLAEAFSHHANSTSGGSSRIDSQVAGFSCDTEMDPQLQQPLFEVGVSVLTSEQQIVDLGKMARLNL